jgi:hypothetical protein
MLVRSNCLLSAIAWVLIAAAGLTACDKPGEDTGTIDSAGVRIVDNARPQIVREWARVDSEPELEIGKVEGTEPYLFSRLRTAAMRSTGEIVVVDRGAQEIRIFDPRGIHLRSLGRTGEGPGEFLAIDAIRLTSPDTVLVWDATLLRLSWFTLDGKFVKDQSLAGSRTGGMTLRRVSGDRWEVLRDGTVVGNDIIRGRDGEGIIQQRISLVIRSGSDGLSFIPDLVGSPTVRVGKAEVGSYLHPNVAPYNWAVRSAPAEIIAADHPDGGWALSVYDFNGVMKASIRAPIPRRKITEDLVRIQNKWILDFGGKYIAPDQRRNFGLAMSRLPVPDSAPAISTVITDAAGRLWVQRWRGRRWEPTDGRIDIYDVIDQSGMWLGSVNVDASLGRILSIGEDHILFDWTGPMDIPRVRKHRLHRSVP